MDTPFKVGETPEWPYAFFGGEHYGNEMLFDGFFSVRIVHYVFLANACGWGRAKYVLHRTFKVIT